MVESTQTVLLQFAGDWGPLTYCGQLLQTLAPPVQNATLWEKLLVQWTQEPYYLRILSAPLWSFQLWLLKRALQMRPLPTEQQILPWLNIPAWEKLDEVLKLSQSLPVEWERSVISQRIGRDRDRIPKLAVEVVQTHEAKFRDTLKSLLKRQNAQSSEVVMQFFQAIGGLFGTQTVSLYLSFCSASPWTRSVIERLFAAVPPLTEHQLTSAERDMVLEACNQEVIAVSSQSPTLTTYIQEYLQNLDAQQAHEPECAQSVEPIEHGSNVALYDHQSGDQLAQFCRVS